MWLEDFAKELKLQGQPITIKYDSQSVIYLLNNSACHYKTKYIHVRLLFVMEKIERGEVKVVKVSTDHDVVDMITKTLPSIKFFCYIHLINLRDDNVVDYGFCSNMEICSIGSSSSLNRGSLRIRHGRVCML